GIRVKGLTDAAIEKDLNEGKILRTHVLRPTWHFVSPADIGWMLKLTAPKIKGFAKIHYRQLGIDEAMLIRSKNVLTSALANGKQLSREELLPLFKNNKVNTDDTRISFLLMDAELDGLICSGARKGKQFTYALLEERVPNLKQLDLEEALATLAKRYFISRGPATVKDFAWWSGLNISDAKLGLELTRVFLNHEIINGQAYWFSNQLPEAKKSTGIYLLPAFDEYNIAYQNRDFSIGPEYQIKTRNGIFKPSLLINGRVAGLWKRTEKKDTVLIEVNPFTKLSDLAARKITVEAKRYGKFLGKKSLVQ
ncbi:MAG: Winged helix DNA-binding protein, partial [Mucilaginibacter sp.]|nr:Winged helix DNA-binding protein [Mucilaginibacter sp.]